MSLLLRASAMVALGVSTTVATSWIIAVIYGLFPQWNEHALKIHKQQTQNVWVSGHHRIGETHWTPMMGVPQEMWIHFENGSASGIGRPVPFRWNENELWILRNGGTVNFGTAYYAVGWPARALVTHVGSSDLFPAQYKTALVIRDAGSNASGIPNDLVLPFKPLWTGFVMNTALFAALWIAAFFAVPRARSAIRYRRGLCPHCKYDLSGEFVQACPECGRINGRVCEAPSL